MDAYPLLILHRLLQFRADRAFVEVGHEPTYSLSIACSQDIELDNFNPVDPVPFNLETPLQRSKNLLTHEALPLL